MRSPLSPFLNLKILSDEGDKALGPRGQTPIAQAEQAGTGEAVVLRVGWEIGLRTGGQAH